MTDKSSTKLQQRGGWRALRDGFTSYVTSGAQAGTNGYAKRRAFLRAYAVIALFMTFVDIVNVFTALHDAARQGQALAAWEPVTWEFTSGAAELVACPIIYAALLMAATGRVSWWRSAAIHAVSSLLFSALHIGLMMVLRIGIYGAFGFRYRIESWAAPYEYRKDLVAYLVLAGLFHVFARSRSAAADAQKAVSPSLPRPMPQSFDIIDGTRTLRVPMDGIVALTSAGNYVEFHLRDGRRKLMRATLRELEVQLAAAGFERTHRSWLINATLVRCLQSIGSGDYTVELEGGLQAPLSRRYNATLRRLRQKSEVQDSPAP